MTEDKRGMVDSFFPNGVFLEKAVILTLLMVAVLFDVFIIQYSKNQIFVYSDPTPFIDENVKIYKANKTEHTGAKEDKNQKSAKTASHGIYLYILNKYKKNVSPISAGKIASAIILYSREFHIDSHILTAIIEKESSFKWWIEHKPVVIPIYGKKKKVRAVGLCGIIWEIWKDQLKKAKIAFNRSDLFIPEVNIKACAYILNRNKSTKVQLGKTPMENAVIRHYGATKSGLKYKRKVYAIAHKIKRAIELSKNI